MDNPLYRSFVDWNAQRVNPDYPGPKSLAEFIELHQCEKKTLSEFIKLEHYPDDLLQATLTWAKQKSPELIYNVYKEVKTSRSVADLERFLSLVHDLKRKDPKTGNQYNFINLNPEQYAAILTREARVLEAGRAESPAQLLPAA